MDCWLLLLLFIGLNGSIRIIISPLTAYADVWSLYPGAGRRCLKLPSIALIDRTETFFIRICLLLENAAVFFVKNREAQAKH